jgi:UDP-N-acetylmuramyl pentapeptide phosphotransferase/UDP-N-acetylglucosamine-1-phosphate transferase
MTEMKFVLEAALAFLIVFVSTPIVILVCNALKLYDPPGPLKIHTRPVPRLGGVAVTAGLLTAIAFVLSPQAAGIAEFAACIAIVAVLGIVDDLRGVSPYVRLAVQVGVGTYMGTAGWGIALTNSSIVNALIACAVVVLFINAFNFLDGADGITAGVTAAIALAFILAEPYRLHGRCWAARWPSSLTIGRPPASFWAMPAARSSDSLCRFSHSSTGKPRPRTQIPLSICFRSS